MRTKKESIIFYITLIVSVILISDLVELLLGRDVPDVSSLLYSIAALFTLKVIVLIVSLFFKNLKYSGVITESLFFAFIGNVIMLGFDLDTIFTWPVITYDRIIWATIKIPSITIMIMVYYFFYKSYVDKRIK